MKKWLIASLCIVVLSGCATFGSSPADERLNKGIKEYEQGNYTASANILQGVLEAPSASKENKTIAYKYLAFIQCVTAREKACREYFKKAIALDPDFDLTPAEAGHPLWGPAFRSVKGKSTK